VMPVIPGGPDHHGVESRPVYRRVVPDHRHDIQTSGLERRQRRLIVEIEVGFGFTGREGNLISGTHLPVQCTPSARGKREESGFSVSRISTPGSGGRPGENPGAAFHREHGLASPHSERARELVEVPHPWIIGHRVVAATGDDREWNTVPAAYSIMIRVAPSACMPTTTSAAQGSSKVNSRSANSTSRCLWRRSKVTHRIPRELKASFNLPMPPATS